MTDTTLISTPITPTIAYAVRIGSDLSLYRERERAELIISHAAGGVLVELVDRKAYEHLKHFVEERGAMVDLLRHLTEGTPEEIALTEEEGCNWVLQWVSAANPNELGFDAVMKNRPEKRTPLQWYWVNVILAGREAQIIDENLRMKLDPDDPRVLTLMGQGMAVDEAAEIIFRGGK